MGRFYRLLCLTFMSVFVSCSATIEKLPKINGVSYVASDETISEMMVQPLVQLHANYAALMPFGFLRDLEHPEINYNMERQWFGERKEGIRQYAEVLRNRHIKIMLKPQIWVMKGAFTGYIEMSNQKDWEMLETSYASFILAYAQLAQELDVSVFCIGTELERFVAERPLFWTELIKKVRAVYTGPLTYAANWNEYFDTPFWKELDYIGIDAYFPITQEQTPTLNESKKGWQNHKAALKTHAEKFHKQILFTEFGYRSIDYAGREPWTVDRVDHQVNLEAQHVLLQALFEELWPEDWFAGGFVWKWFHHHPKAGGRLDNRFTPQNKPAEDIIRSFYKNYST